MKSRRTAVVYDRGAATPLEIVDGAGEYGELVFVCDSRSPYLADALPLLSELAETIVISDPAEAIDRLGTLGVDGVVTFSDSTLPLCMEIIEALGLRGHGRATTEALTDKLVQRERFRSGGVPTPEFLAPDSLLGIADAVAAIGVPCVVKPRRSCEGRHTYPVAGPAEVAAVLPAITPVWPAVGGFMVEEMLVGDRGVAGSRWGDYVSVESVTVAGVPRQVAVIGKLPLQPPFREAGHVFPSTLDLEAREAVFDMAGRAVRALGIRDGISHTEIKLTPDGPRVIEVNGRLGSMVEATVEPATGVSLLKVAFAVATGAVEELPALLDRIVPGDTVSYLLSAYPPADVVDGSVVGRISGVDKLRALPGVLAVLPTKKRGDRLLVSDGMAGDLVKVYGTADSHEQVLAIVDRMGELVVLNHRGRPA